MLCAATASRPAGLLRAQRPAAALAARIVAPVAPLKAAAPLQRAVAVPALPARRATVVRVQATGGTPAATPAPQGEWAGARWGAVGRRRRRRPRLPAEPYPRGGGCWAPTPLHPMRSGPAQCLCRRPLPQASSGAPT